MLRSLTAIEVLDREFLEVRAKLLELAAALDRLDRAAGSVADDIRRQQIDAILDLLRESGPHRTERAQQVLSLPYLDDWRQRFEIDTQR
jgi:hypothetical protein